MPAPCMPAAGTPCPQEPSPHCLSPLLLPQRPAPAGGPGAAKTALKAELRWGRSQAAQPGPAGSAPRRGPALLRAAGAVSRYGPAWHHLGWARSWGVAGRGHTPHSLPACLCPPAAVFQVWAGSRSRSRSRVSSANVGATPARPLCRAAAWDPARAARALQTRPCVLLDRARSWLLPLRKPRHTACGARTPTGQQGRGGSRASAQALEHGGWPWPLPRLSAALGCLSLINVCPPPRPRSPLLRRVAGRVRELRGSRAG